MELKFEWIIILCDQPQSESGDFIIVSKPEMNSGITMLFLICNQKLVQCQSIDVKSVLWLTFSSQVTRILSFCSFSWCQQNTKNQHQTLTQAIIKLTDSADIQEKYLSLTTSVEATKLNQSRIELTGKLEYFWLHLEKPLKTLEKTSAKVTKT